MSRTRSSLFVLSFLICLVVAVPSVFAAATLTRTVGIPNVLNFGSDLSDPSTTLTFTQSAGNVTFALNSPLTINFSPPCAGAMGTPNVATCPFAMGDRAEIVLTDQADTFLASSPVPADLSVNGVDGNDSITTGSGTDTLDGAQADDTLVGMGGNDTFIGGAGDHDLVSYAYSSATIVASINGAATSGDTTASEHDSIATDVEDLTGGTNNDTLTGSATANVLRGLSGSDTLNGGDGPDNLIVGSPSEGSANVANGGEGDDTIDTLNAAIDTVSCGSGYDTVTANTNDIISADCENVNGSATVAPVVPIPTPAPVPAPAPTPAPVTTTPAPAPLPTRPSVSFASHTLRLKNGAVSLPVQCGSSSAARCGGTVTLKARIKGKNVVIGTARVSIASGIRKSVAVKLNAKGRRALRKRKLKATAVVSVTDAAGATAAAKATVTIRR